MKGGWVGRIPEGAHRRELPWPIGLARPGEDKVAGTDPSGLMLSRPPETPLQALMETAPGDTVPESAVELLPLREALEDGLCWLETQHGGERLRWIFDAHVNRGLSVRAIGAELNLAKSYVHRLYLEAVRLLALHLQDNPEVARRLVNNGGPK
jgi:hypothetical protein